MNSLGGELGGRYFPLTGMNEEDRLSLVASHFLFKRGDRFMESAGSNRDWPGGGRLGGCVCERERVGRGCE